ncbi:Alpha/Beta hydrolase protein [Elsinoe ampelina]|uniref:Alpha/Beta hydrolase protein n=1 Tax=Elsinoe ampelina TaxID=302913 RepID=A0A6A6G898_9PEZI|nr:Alpha/Beta hydrolase protein [Elsinoe ampelina]
MRSFTNAAVLLGGVASLAQAQFPKTPEGVTVLDSKLQEGVKISFKENTICEGSKSYAGYVQLPPGLLDQYGTPQDYFVNTFFWYFEAQESPETAQTTIWMNGGPGSSSMFGLLDEHGPCFVNSDSNSTYPNPWSWNREVNMIYLDQPNQVGHSYDLLRNVTKNFITGSVTTLPANATVPAQNTTFQVGTYPSGNSNNTARGSRNGAYALWHFAQTWFDEFPYLKPEEGKISVATQSYGGRYGPAMVSFFEEQNQRIEKGELEAEILRMDTLMLVNACIDRAVQWPSYPEMAVNNTYGIKTVNDTVYEGMRDSVPECISRIEECQAVADVYDPEHIGINATVNRLCQSAESWCTRFVRDPYTSLSGRAYYDVAVLEPNLFPPPFYQGFLNQPWVQDQLGVPLNWTGSSSASSNAFRGMGDYLGSGWLDYLAFLLENDIKVNLFYGDRDFACNWIGGEAASLAIDYSGSEEFRAAGYQPILTNETYIGGQVRQHGNLSFVRLYEAGHEAPAYQPETAYKILMRLLNNKDVATGQVDIIGNPGYSTQGPQSVGNISTPGPTQPAQFCYILDPGSCFDEQYESVINGTALIVDYIVVDANSTKIWPDLAKRTGVSAEMLQKRSEGEERTYNRIRSYEHDV